MAKDDQGAARTIRYQEIADDAARSGRRWRVRRRQAAAERGRAVARVRRQPGHDPPRARGAARRGAASTPARGSAGSWPADPMRQTPRPPGHDRGPDGRVGHPPRAADPRVRLRRRQQPRRRRARYRAGAAGQAAEPRRRRAVRRRDRVVPGRARPAACPALDVERSPFYELLDIPLRGATQTIGADAASADRRRPARHPGWLAGAALRAGHHRRERHAGAGVEHIFPAHRTEFVVDLPQAEPSIAPSGLRLVE